MGEREHEGRRLGVRPDGLPAGWLHRIPIIDKCGVCVRVHMHMSVWLCAYTCVWAGRRARGCICVGEEQPCPIGKTAGYARLLPSYSTGKCNTGRDKPTYERQGLRCVGLHEPGDGGGRRQARTTWHPPSRVWCFIGNMEPASPTREANPALQLF
jgi:hypothetical protein